MSCQIKQLAERNTILGVPGLKASLFHNLPSLFKSLVFLEIYVLNLMFSFFPAIQRSVHQTYRLVPPHCETLLELIKSRGRSPITVYRC